MGSSIYSGQKLKVPSNIYASTSSKSVKTRNSFTNESELKDELIKVAKKYLGAPYKFGGTSTKTGIDCSAYVNKVFKSFDVYLPRTARGIYKKGNHVSKSKLQKGDLVFFRTYAKFPSHVGIYMGNGNFIHASSAKKKVIITKLSGNYYQKRYIGAKRIKIIDSYAKNINK
jgi:cell wall-associated NlpC family hydrolase